MVELIEGRAPAFGMSDVRHHVGLQRSVNQRQPEGVTLLGDDLGLGCASLSSVRDVDKPSNAANNPPREEVIAFS
ncbi:MAG: hypothetical protein IT424_12495 [Pirellulales bacterium]|nr:hypothetical protein [Pirellulales bacterium]